MADRSFLGFSRKTKISISCANDGEPRQRNHWATSMLGRSRVRAPNRSGTSRYPVEASSTQRKARASLNILLPVLSLVAKATHLLGLFPRSQVALYLIRTPSLFLRSPIRRPLFFTHHNLILILTRIHTHFLLHVHRNRRETHPNIRHILAAGHGVQLR